MWPNEETFESAAELGDEMERDNVYAPVDGPFRPLPLSSDLPLSEDQKEYGKIQIELCRMELDKCRGYDVA